jgi:hypothetical protein
MLVSQQKHDTPASHSQFTTIRLLLSAIGEEYYLWKNSLDHVVSFSENIYHSKEYLPRRLKEYRGQKRVAFLFHGYLQGRSAFERMERLFESQLYNIFGISASNQPYSRDIRLSADQSLKWLEKILPETDAEEVYLIGHSQGGLIARYILQVLQPASLLALTKKCITLATPNLGTYSGIAAIGHKFLTSTLALCHLLPPITSESGIQMLPQSSLLRELNRQPLPAGIDFVSIYSYLDPLVWPPRLARLPYPEAKNILLMKIGHLQTLYNIQVYDLILKEILLPPQPKKRQAATMLGKDILDESFIQDQGHGIIFEEIVGSTD